MESLKTLTLADLTLVAEEQAAHRLEAHSPRCFEQKTCQKWVISEPNLPTNKLVGWKRLISEPSTSISL